MIYEILAELLGVFVMNWTFFVVIQSVVVFRRMLLCIWKKVAFFTAGTVWGIYSSIAAVLTLLLGIAFIFGKEGSFYLSEYQNNHIFPLVSVICMEFAELIVMFFKYFLVRHTRLEKIKTAKVEAVIEKIRTQLSVFQKPNLALLQ